MQAVGSTGGWWRALPRLVVALLIPTALIVGLLSMPTTCHCGAEHPHTHTIFELGHHDHRHGSSSESDRPAHADRATRMTRTTRATLAEQPQQTTQRTAASDDAQVEHPAPSFSSSLALILPTGSAATADLVGEQVTHNTQRLHGHATRPPAPPPQLVPSTDFT